MLISKDAWFDAQRDKKSETVSTFPVTWVVVHKGVFEKNLVLCKSSKESYILLLKISFDHWNLNQHISFTIKKLTEFKMFL